MKNVFEYMSYRPLLRDQALRRKSEDPSWTLQRLAENALLQPPYLTNVFKERAHLSGDQFFTLAQIFGWNDDEQNYGHLLLEWERSAVKRRKDDLKKKIDEIRNKQMQSKTVLKKEVLAPNIEEHGSFFLNPFYSLIHSLLGVPRFARDPRRICRCLNLDPVQLQTWLKDLVKFKFIAPAETGYTKLKKNFHLPKESPLCEPHQSLMQQTANRHLQTLPADEKYGFSVTFSADPATRDQVQREFLKFLKNVEPLVQAAPVEELYGMRFDLFRWSHEKI